MIENTINMLGLRARDRVSGFRGTLTSASFDLYGCVQLAISPDVKEGDAEIKHGHWFDVSRIELLDQPRVMPVPDYQAMATVAEEPQSYRKGPAVKEPPR